MNWQQRITRLKRDPRPERKPVPAAISAPVPFVDATGRQCRYPLWDDATPADERMVCGAPTAEGASWCAGHCEAVFSHDNGPDRRSPAHRPRTDDEAPAVKAAA